MAGGTGGGGGEGAIFAVFFAPFHFFVAALAEAFDGGGEDAFGFFRLGVVFESEGVLVGGAAVATLPAHILGAVGWEGWVGRWGDECVVVVRGGLDWCARVGLCLNDDIALSVRRDTSGKRAAQWVGPGLGGRVGHARMMRGVGERLDGKERCRGGEAR